MQFISMRDLRGKSSEVWNDLSSEREMVITSNGKPVAILSHATDDTVEEALRAIRKSRAVAAVESIKMKSVEEKKDKTTLAEINKEIAAVRKKRVR